MCTMQRRRELAASLTVSHSGLFTVSFQSCEMRKSHERAPDVCSAWTSWQFLPLPSRRHLYGSLRDLFCLHKQHPRRWRWRRRQKIFFVFIEIPGFRFFFSRSSAILSSLTRSLRPNNRQIHSPILQMKWNVPQHRAWHKTLTEKHI